MEEIDVSTIQHSPPRRESSQSALKLDRLWDHLPEPARQAALQALTRIIFEAAKAGIEVSND